MEWARTTALAAASKPESFMLLDSFFFSSFFKYKSEESSRIFSWVPWTGIKIFSSPCPTDEESRLQTVPVYRSGWVAMTQCPVTQSSFSLSSMLMNRCPTSPCWRHAWDCPIQHSANVTAWPGYTADVFVEAVCCGTQLAVFWGGFFYVITTLLNQYWFMYTSGLTNTWLLTKF